MAHIKFVKKKLLSAVKNLGYTDAHAGKSIGSFNEAPLEQHTEQLRGAYEVAWRAGKTERDLPEFVHVNVKTGAKGRSQPMSEMAATHANSVIARNGRPYNGSREKNWLRSSRNEDSIPDGRLRLF
jgi:hypothetical protein